jgi:uncharacterized protein (DUF2062 family)
MKGRLGRALQILLHVEDTPHRIALSFAIGVWLAFNPLFGAHTAMALGIAFLFRLSRAAMLVGAYINNPWTLAPMYTAGTFLGSWLLGVSPHGIEEIDWDLSGAAFYASLLEGLRPYLWPYVVGNLILGVVAALPAYILLRTFLERRKHGVEAGGTPS